MVKNNKDRRSANISDKIKQQRTTKERKLKGVNQNSINNNNQNKPSKSVKKAQSNNSQTNKLAVNHSKKSELNNKVHQVKQNNRRHNKLKTKTSFNKLLNKPSIRIAFLGGLNEIGKNITVFECMNDMFILDCGLAFPDGDMLGIDLVLPDFTYIERNKDRIKGLVLTHGHEDHIGAIPYLLKSGLNFPIYGAALTIGLLSSKLKEHRLLGQANMNVIKPGQKISLGCMDVEFIHVNHSIPDALGVAIHSPAGTVVHTGDFKIDCTPPHGRMIDLVRFAELGKNGVLALLADSTNAERPGYTLSERKVADSFEILFQKANNKRIIIASFASNINRIYQIINIAIKFNRKVAFSGRSMLNYIAIAKGLGYIDVPEEVIIDIDQVSNYPNEGVVIITTGSQGEPMSALARMANSDHRKVVVGPNDFIIISAKPIPGNEKTVGAVINELMKKGCEVIYESMYEVHVSGHACQEELKIIHGLTKPKYFIPVHGEQKHLVKNKLIAEAMGLNETDVFVGENGNYLEIHESYIDQLNNVPSGKVLVDGIGIGDVGSIVLRDRKRLGQDGLIIVVATIDSQNRQILAGPDIVSRGFVYVRQSEQLIESARKKAVHVLNTCAKGDVREWSMIKTKMKEDLSKLFYEYTHRSPMILPVIMEV